MASWLKMVVLIQAFCCLPPCRMESSSGPGPASPEPKPSKGPEKPPYSFVALIALAIQASPEQRLPLRGIYQAIAQRFPYYRLGEKGWQNSVRHNLSLNSCFLKLPREGQDRGRGHDWALDPACQDMFQLGNYRRRRSIHRVAPKGPLQNPSCPCCLPYHSPPATYLLAAPALGQPQQAYPLSPGIGPMGGYGAFPGFLLPSGPAAQQPPSPTTYGGPITPYPQPPEVPFMQCWNWQDRPCAHLDLAPSATPSQERSEQGSF